MPHRRTLTHDEYAGAPFAPDLHDARHLWLKAALLLVWVLVSFVAGYFARDLQVMVRSWQLSYWLASQGAVLVFMAIVTVYCLAMNHFERQDKAAQDKAAQGKAGGAGEPPAHD